MSSMVTLYFNVTCSTKVITVNYALYDYKYTMLSNITSIYLTIYTVPRAL